MSKIITISRQYASGGRAIGKSVAKYLDIPFYDKTIIDVTAKESGFDPAYIERAEQTTTTSFLYNLALNGMYTQPLTDQLFAAESKVIRSLADKGPCVIVGRCADYVLREQYNCFNVFVHSTDKFRIDRIVEFDKLSPEQAADIIKQKDKARRRHYKYYTERVWGDSQNYDLCVNTATCGLEASAKIIAELVSK
ncbi:MAG: cytidylate kinase-like family protein [Eubacterium sp.]|nr:cytidylate kinase-like family protein [Eubacterium sp.]